MKSGGRWPIRWWLASLVAGAVLPVLVLSSWLFVSHVRDEETRARAIALRIAKATASRMGDLHTRSVALLDRMAQRPAIRSFNGSCDSLFAIVDFFPEYADLILFDDSGNVVCHTESEDSEPVPGFAEGWIARELRAKRIQPRRPVTHGSGGRWISAITVPITRPDGTSGGTLALVQLPNITGTEAMPPNSVITILDAEGTILARSKEPEKWMGRNARGLEVVELALANKEGTAQASGIDGTQRQYGFAQVPEIGWYVYVGVPTSMVMQPVRSLIVRGVIGGVAIVLVVMLIAFLLARRISAHINAIANTALRASKGRYGTPVEIRGPHEIAMLAESFNEMVGRRIEAERQSNESEAKLKALSDRLLVLQEQERTRIARELHDDLGQSLTALKMDFLGVLGAIPETDANRRTRERIVKTLDATVSAVQRISSELRPSILDDLGLVAAIESEARLFEERTGIECELSLPAEPPPIDSACASAIYRIVQESLTNVSRHSNASRVELRLRPRAGALLLDIRDDGRGVTEHELHDPASLGLIGIRERAAIVGGTAEFQGIDGRGTIVSVSIPLRQENNPT
jgi:signal transduction histidine kinase